jgi:hypothetical protein
MILKAPGIHLKPRSSGFREFARVLACAWRLAGICESGGIQLHDVNEPAATQMATAPSVDDQFG